MNIRKMIRNLFVAGKSEVDSSQKFIRRMTNWQNSQWLRAGADRDKAEEFSLLKRENRHE